MFLAFLFFFFFGFVDDTELYEENEEQFEDADN